VEQYINLQFIWQNFAQVGLQLKFPLRMRLLTSISIN